MPMDESKKRTVAYCRVSKNYGQEVSLESQVRYFNEVMDADPLMVNCGCYIDNGISGRFIGARKDFKRMMQDAELHKIDFILCKSIKRFGRCTLDTIRAVTRLTELNIPVYFEQENLHTIKDRNNILLVTMAQIAQEEYEEKSEAIKWTFKKRFEQGQLIVNPNTPLGYKFNEDGQLVVVPEEAKIVKRIYESYAKGVGTAEIARRLNKDGYTTAHGRQFLASTILYIIKNEKYKGDAMLQKYVVADGKKIKNMGEAQQYYVENDHEPIVSRELWDTCQRMIERHKTSEYVRAENREFDPFKGKIVCGKCGHNFQRIKRSDKKTRYGCYLKSSRGMNACRSESVKLETLERVFVAIFNMIEGKRKTLMEMQVTDEVRGLDNEITRMLNQEKTYLQLQARGLLHGEIEEEYRKLLNRIVKAEEQKKAMLETNGQNVKAQNDLKVYNSAVMRTGKLTELEEKVFEQIVRRIVVVDREHLAFHLASGEIAYVSIIYWATSEDEIQSIDIKAVTEVC